MCISIIGTSFPYSFDGAFGSEDAAGSFVILRLNYEKNNGEGNGQQRINFRELATHKKTKRAIVTLFFEGKQM